MSITTRFRVEKISPERLLTIGVNVLHRAFHEGPRVDAKRRYQFIMERRPVYLLNMSMETGAEVKVVMSLERSELRGRLNFSLFRQLIAQLLVNYSELLSAGQPPNVFSDAQNRRWVFLHPAFCNTPEGLNALALAMDMGRPGELRLELMFLDPQQFIKKDPS